MTNDEHGPHDPAPRDIEGDRATCATCGKPLDRYMAPGGVNAAPRPTWRHRAGA